jgi:hypothetical protein
LEEGLFYLEREVERTTAVVEQKIDQMEKWTLVRTKTLDTFGLLPGIVVNCMIELIEGLRLRTSVGKVLGLLEV